MLYAHGVDAAWVRTVDVLVPIKATEKVYWWVFRVWLETVSALSERNCEAMHVWFANALQSA